MGASGGLDLNGGGDDFVVGVLNRNSAPSSAQVVFFPQGIARGALNSGNQLRQLASGFNISGGAAAWRDGLGAVMRAAQTGGYAAGQWLAGQTGFAGIRLALGGGNFQYGWIRMRVDDANPADGLPDTLTVFDYAYQTDANVAILAGDGVPPVPEPGTTALLALAGAGAAALRHRRRRPVSAPATAA